MIGIYKITNNLNGKAYIGQSNDINRRWREHCSPTRWEWSKIPVEVAIHKYGAENFTLEVLEECLTEELNERETFWIRYYNTVVTGYNCNEGGTIGVQEESNPNAKVSREDVIAIRSGYANHLRKKDLYELVKDKITFTTFEGIFEGRTWPSVMPEVYTPENKLYYSTQATNGENSSSAILTNEEVMYFRNAYVNKTAKELYPECNGRISFQTFQRILGGTTYQLLPFYSKKLNKWFYNGERPVPQGKRGQQPSRAKSVFSDEEVIQFRTDYINMAGKDVYKKYNITQVSFESFQKMLTGKTYNHLPVYSKKQQKWINK